MKKIRLSRYKDLSESAKASIAYTFANFVSKGASIITVPLFTRIMSTSEVGVSTTYNSWATILYSVVTLSLTSGSVNIAMMDYEGRRDQYQSACLTLSTLSGLLFLLFYLVGRERICEFTTLSHSVMILLCLRVIINPALDLWNARQKYERKYKLSVAVSISMTFLSAALSLLSVWMLRDASGINLGVVRVLAQGIIMLMYGVFAYVFVLAKGRCFVDLSVWKYAIKLSLPLIIHTLSKRILDMSDRLMITSMCGLAEAGIYGTLYNLAMVSLLVWDAINASLIPTMFDNLKKKEYIPTSILCERILCIFGAVTVFISLLAPEVLTILTTPEYVSAVRIIPALCAGIYATALYNIYGNVLLFKKKTVNVMIATNMAAVVNILLNFIFIKIYGYTAAAYTTFVSFVLLAVFQGVMVRIVFNKPVFNDKKLFAISIVVSAICMLCNLVYDYTWVRYAAICMIAIYGVVNRKKVLQFLGM